MRHVSPRTTSISPGPTKGGHQVGGIRPADHTRLNGTVTGVSADLSRDPVTGEKYFLARIGLSDAELKKLGVLKLVPGMPADVQIRTADRTALSYLVKPLQDQIEKAFRER